MTLTQSVKNRLNGYFEKSKFPMKIDNIFFYRPTYFESYHENYEVLNEVERLYECDHVYVLLEFHHEDLFYEYELRYKNSGNRLENTMCILKYWELMSEEELEEAERRMTPLTMLLATSMIPSLLHFLYETKRKEG